MRAPCRALTTLIATSPVDRPSPAAYRRDRRTAPAPPALSRAFVAVPCASPAMPPPPAHRLSLGVSRHARRSSRLGGAWRGHRAVDPEGGLSPAACVRSRGSDRGAHRQSRSAEAWDAAAILRLVRWLRTYPGSHALLATAALAADAETGERSPRIAPCTARRSFPRDRRSPTATIWSCTCSRPL